MLDEPLDLQRVGRVRSECEEEDGQAGEDRLVHHALHCGLFLREILSGDTGSLVAFGSMCVSALSAAERT